MLTGVAEYREVEVCRTLSSRSRFEIFKLLMRGPMSIEEMSEATNLRPLTVRHHIRALERVNIVQNYEKRGHVGRPRLYYRITKAPPVISFPARHYAEFLNATVKALKTRMKPAEINDFFAELGRNAGLQIVKDLEQSHRVKSWDLKQFKDLFVDKYLAQSGVEPDVISINSRLTFRLHNCPVQELALENPDLYCDIFDHAMNDGIRKGTKDTIELKRTTCIAYGDPYCEFVCHMIPAR